LNQAFASAFRRHRKEDAFCYKRDAAWMKVSHDDFAECVREARAGFLECGVTRGDRVGLLSENRLEWTITDMALLSCGAVDVPIYATLTGPQAAFILNDAGAEVVCVSTRKQLEKLLAVVGDLPCVKTIVTFDEVSGVAAPAGVRVIDFAELRRRGRAAGGAGGDFLADMERTAEPDDLATLIYTSGTTGNPKGVMLTHRNLTSNLLAGIDRLPCRPEDVALSYLPLAHVYERTVMNVFIYSGVTVYFAESVDLVAKNLQEVHPTVMTSVPRVFEKILNKIEEEGEKAGGLKTTIFRWAMDVGREYVKLKNAGRDVPPFLALQYEAAWALALSKIRERVAPRIQFFSSGGAALPDKVAYSFAALGMPILQGYGLTETSPVIAANSAAENRYGTVGRPLRDVEVRIAEDGEILVRGPNVMRGYYNQPDKTDEVLKDGWFHTGDIGELDAAGYLRITDRKKDLFKTSGGKYVAPQPIENRLTTSPHIVQAVVIGNGRKFPAALIVPREESLKAFAAQKGVTYGGYAELLKNPQVIDFIQKEVDRLTPDLAQYEKIKKVALLEKELTLETGELTPTLKVKRRVVDEKFQATIDALYEEKSARAAGGGE
jgi:long-chain acyl-CoA synthetase